MAEENETNPMADLVQHALDQDFNKANKVFGDVMGTRINDILDQEKVKLADQIYNGVQPDDEDEEAEEEQLELDLADQEETDEEDAEVEEDESEEYEDEDEVEDYEEDEEQEEDLDAHDG
jgi:hypothetical protein